MTIETLSIAAPILAAVAVGLFVLATNYFDDNAAAKRASLKPARSFREAALRDSTALEARAFERPADSPTSYAEIVAMAELQEVSSFDTSDIAAMVLGSTTPIQSLGEVYLRRAEMSWLRLSPLKACTSPGL